MSVVRRSQAVLAQTGERAVHYAAYYTISSFVYLMLLLFFGTIFQFLAQRAWGRLLLLKYPGVFSCGMFSRAGPTQEQIAHTTFSMTFIGRGNSPGQAVRGIGVCALAPARQRASKLSNPEYLSPRACRARCSLSTARRYVFSCPVSGEVLQLHPLWEQNSASSVFICIHLPQITRFFRM